MTVYYGVNANKILVDNPSKKVGVGEQGGRLRVIYDTFELSEDFDADDTIEMGGLIPAGARVIDVHLFHDALGAGTLDVGWKASADAAESASADGFINGAAVTSQGHASLQEDHFAEAGMFKKFAAPVQPIVKVATDTSATEGTIGLAIMYVLD